MKKPLTDIGVKNMKLPATGQRDVFDQGYPGLALRLSYAGTKSFVIFHTVNSKTRRVTVGQYPRVTLAEAREQWRLIREGKTMTAVAALPIITEAPAPVINPFESVFEEYLKRGQDGNRATYIAEVKSQIGKHVLPHWKGRDIASITRLDVIAVIDRIADSGAATMARRVQSKLGTLFTWALGRGLVAINPASDVPTQGKETRRDRVLTDAELAGAWNSDQLGIYSDPIKLLVLTGCRLNEVSNLRWSEIEGDTLNLPGDRTKNYLPHTVPLSAQARELIERRRVRGTGEFVFATHGKSTGSWSQTRARLGGDWTIHDIRRTVATNMGERLKVPPHIIEACLNHVSGSKAGVAGTYNRATYLNEKREALELWATEVQTIVNPLPRILNGK